MPCAYYSGHREDVLVEVLPSETSLGLHDGRLEHASVANALATAPAFEPDAVELRTAYLKRCVDPFYFASFSNVFAWFSRTHACAASKRDFREARS
jgi:hypothetical protein